ncbi:hypothetical protein BHU61_05060 [Macrococcus epidermidis]|uniref:Uncharacterized protein n=1 Tax=Macrococcus epidermidis TaxID=1902580 RepID=A0A327ZX90_9STAP|nr:hypothetical protein [Macrococcus epidermidis]RAK46832.1 hypothetical protein BHU61_05060 [Macrococcus epidermidis]
MVDYIIRILIFASICGAQYILSSTKFKWLGLVVPLICTVYAISFYMNDNQWPLWVVLVLYVIGMVVLAGQYNSARKEYHRKKVLELDKMKSKDL